MHQTIDDIDYQARQGSVAAIIQILNEHFADSNIRTRAVQDNGVLQLLLEAPQAEQLPQNEVVEDVRQVLESISPRGITRVNINSRIVREQQLLWLDEIKRDPQNSLLWSEPITLNRPNFIVRFWQDLRAPRQRNLYLDDVPSRTKRSSSQLAFWRGLIGGASICLLLLIVGWTMKDWLGLQLGPALPGTEETEVEAETPPTSEPSPTPVPDQDPFVLAVRIAQQSVEDGKSATTAAAWLDLAARWQRASDLMAEVPPEDERYAIAQDRIAAYASNKEMALQEAENLQNQGTN
jgi:hypothetical protein